MENWEKYFHLEEVDHYELMSVLLHHFGGSEGISIGVYKYKAASKTSYLEVHVDINSSQINTIKFSANFTEEELKEIETKVKDKLLTASSKVAQDIIFCHEQVTGFFRYKDKFQILPVPEGSSFPIMGFKEYPFLIQFSYQSSSDPMIDWSRRLKEATIYTRVLNLLTNQHLRLKSSSGECHWVMDIDEKAGKASYSYKQQGYSPEPDPKREVDQYSSVEGLEKIEVIPFQKYYLGTQGVTSNSLCLPDNIEKSLDVAFALVESDWDRFFMACSWYSQSSSVWRNSHSSAFISLVTALECLMGEREKCEDCKQESPDGFEFCENCKQPRYQVTKNFRVFLEKFVPFIQSMPWEKKVLYSVRSKLAHGMDLLQQDLKPWTFIMSPKKDQDDGLYRNLHLICGVAIYNWLWSKKTSI